MARRFRLADAGTAHEIGRRAADQPFGAGSPRPGGADTATILARRWRGGGRRGRCWDASRRRPAGCRRTDGGSQRRRGAGVVELLLVAGADVDGTGDRLGRGRQEIVQILGDPARFRVGEGFELPLAAEDGHGREVAVLVLDREVGDEPWRLAGIVDVALLQGRSHLARRAAQRVATYDTIHRLICVLVLREHLVRPQPRRGDHGRRRRRPGSAQGAAARQATG